MSEVEAYLKGFKKVRDNLETQDFDKVSDVVCSTVLLKSALVTYEELEDCKVSQTRTLIVLHRVRNAVTSLCMASEAKYLDKICDSSQGDAWILNRAEKLRRTPQAMGFYENMRSVVLVYFIRELMEKKIDRNLMEALDFNSLVRISLRSGGSSVSIPSFNKVESILAHSYYAYLVLVESRTKEYAVEMVKKELDITVEPARAQKDLAKLAIVLDREMKDDNSDMTTLINNALEAMITIQEKLKECLKDVKGVDDVMKLYQDVNKSFLSVTKVLAKLS